MIHCVLALYAVQLTRVHWCRIVTISRDLARSLLCFVEYCKQKIRRKSEWDAYKIISSWVCCCCFGELTTRIICLCSALRQQRKSYWEKLSDWYLVVRLLSRIYTGRFNYRSWSDSNNNSSSSSDSRKYRTQPHRNEYTPIHWSKR